MKTIEEVADGHGYNVLVISSNESFQKEQKSVEVLMANRADGIILALSHETKDYEHIKMIQESGTPIVLFDRTTNELNVSRMVSPLHSKPFNTSFLKVAKK